MSIFARYFWGIFLLVVLILSLVAVILQVNSNRIMDEMGATSAETMNEAFARQVEAQGTNLAGVVAESLVTPVMLREYGAMSDILHAVQAQREVQLTIIFDERGRIIHDGTETLESRGRPLAELVGKVAVPFVKQVVWDKGENLLYCYSPIFIQDSLLGGVLIGLTLENINESVDLLREELAVIQTAALSKNIQVLVSVGGVLLLISLITSFLLARHMARPIADLVAFVGRIGRGKEQPPRAAGRSDEIGKLGRALQTLSQDLKETTVSRDHFRRVLNSMPDGVFVTDFLGGVKMVNQAAVDLLGIEEERLTGKSIKEILQLDRPGKQYQQLLQAEGYQGDELLLCQNDASIPCIVSASAIVDEQLAVVEGCVFVLHDITNRKEAEQTIAAQKERLDVTLRSIGDGVITTDTGGAIVLMNRMAESMTGWTQAEAIGRPLLEVYRVVDEESGRLRENPVDKALLTGDVVVSEENNLLQTRDVRQLAISDSCAPIRDIDGSVMGTVLVFSDITEKRKLLQETLRKEKLESLGMLAGGIAHDFNNILTAILGNLSFLRIKYQSDQQALSKLTLAEKATHKAQSLTQQLLTFSKGGAPVTTTASIQDLITETVQFVLQGSNVRAEFAFEEPLWAVKMDMGQISQVINNLVFNAVQAMPGGGVISVAARNTTIEFGTYLPLEPGKYVQVEVQDHGTGILKDYLTKIFDPYFTTKENGQGLGLATTYSIIKQHKGHILIDSEEGQGTTVTFYLPSSNRQPEQERRQLLSPVAGAGRVLYMDDDPLVLDIIGELLQLLGYTAVPATDGKEAIAQYQEASNKGEPFDLVIMDLTIPGGMGGREAIKELLAFDPEVKAIVASGYSNDPIMSDYQAYGFKGVIKKPFTIEDMQYLLHQIIPADRDREQPVADVS